MDLFEYILIMTSVIFAVAAGRLLMGLGRWVQSTARIRSYVPHSVWVAIVFLMIFANWWANWEFRSIVWTLPTYAYMVVSPTALFFACGLLMPQSFEPEEVDVKQHFLRVRRPFLVAVEARLIVESWRQEYNEGRPHGALGQITPAAYAAGMGQQQRAAA